MTTGSLRLTSVAAVLVLAACSQGGSETLAPTVTQQTFAQALSASKPTANVPATQAVAGTPVVYVSEHALGTVLVYPQKGANPAPLASITGYSGPRGLFVSSKHVLWAADNGADIVYGARPGNAQPTLQRIDANAAPWAVAVTPNGTLYAANQQQCCGMISIFPPKSKYPTSAINPPPSDRNMYVVNGLALDGKGDIFGTYCCTATGTTGVLEVQKGSTTPVDLGITL